ncbi:Chromosomal serine/threonine-protein kinase JIL-1 [Bienertia sinuspersici]
MKVHSSKRSILAKKLWNFLRITLIMVRKGLISKKKLIMDINLFFKRGRLIRKSFSNFLHLHHHHHHHRHQMTRGTFSQREYEFSCSNSPNPVFFHMSSTKRKHHHPSPQSPH